MTTTTTRPAGHTSTTPGTRSFNGPLDSSQSPFAKLITLCQSDVKIGEGFWHSYQATNRRVSLQHGRQMLEKFGNYHDLKIASGLIPNATKADFRGPLFIDSDIYKWLEAVALELTNAPDASLLALADEAIALIASAQTPEGYINTFYQIVEPQNRWKNLAHGHELYCAGHLFQAAVAHHRATGSKSLLNVATRFADYIDQSFGPGEHQLKSPCGHPEIESALIELHRDTGEARYLRLAEFFINQRGYGNLGKGGYFSGWTGEYLQDHVPVREAKTVVGHAVRQLYLTAGIADLYLQTGETALLDAQNRQWRDMTRTKMYVTGGLGSRPHTEGFGGPYELPTEHAYCETCAAIASIFWNWRLLLTTGGGQYADLIERTLFNGFLSGVSLDGKRYFYVNPLLSRGGIERPEWHGCACCPPNVMRLVASLGHYLATTSAQGIQLHQFASGQIRARLPEGHDVLLGVETQYPWDGHVHVKLEEASSSAAWELSIRVPAWAGKTRFAVNGQSVTPDIREGYAHMSRVWKKGDVLSMDLEFKPRLTMAHPHVESARGCVALEYGPLVYCIEQADQPAQTPVLNLQIDPRAEVSSKFRPDVLGGVVTLESSANVLDLSDPDQALYFSASNAPASTGPVKLTAIPYFAWANRDAGAMRVWIPKQ